MLPRLFVTVLNILWLKGLFWQTQHRFLSTTQQNAKLILLQGGLKKTSFAHILPRLLTESSARRVSAFLPSPGNKD